MQKIRLLVLLTLFSIGLNAQRLSVKGIVYDTIEKKPLKNAVITALKFSDSVLVKYTRSDENGVFELNDMPVDTFKVVISQRKFGDKILYVIGSPKNYEFNFNKVIMPPKSVSLDEVTIFAYKDPVYYKGDTLVYTADSFKVKPNATVEDLLKRLPGVKVDSKGKITAQGKEVSKVLVDGDEFFGTDPTMATKNLAANSVESVQVFEKKDENASAESTNDETIKVMNLKLKDDAKKGYFGKASAGSDFQDFYEGELLLNRFRNKQKISLFALGANTPKTGFGWGDIDKYGLENEQNYTWDEENGFVGKEQGQGIPRTLNTGVYYNDKWGKKTKVNANYSYKNNYLVTESEQRSQYFLADTNYITNNYSRNENENQAHSFNLSIVSDLDSLTKLTITPKASYNLSDNSSITRNNFATTSDFVTRETENKNSNTSNNYDVSSGFKLNRSFKKKDRSFTANYFIDIGSSTGTGFLNTKNSFYTTTVNAISDIDQKKENNSSNSTHNASVSFFEPFSKKFKGEVTYEFTYNTNTQYKRSLNKLNGDYSLLDSVFSNDFGNDKYVHQARVKLIYEVKKYRIGFGLRGRNVVLENTNNYTGKLFEQNVSNLLPFANLNYNFNQNTRLYFNYNTNSQQPNINQLQPLPNNTNQNFITLGNPDLLPTFMHQFNLNFNSYKPVSGKYFWMGGNYNITQNAFSSKLEYDSLGRSVSTPINTNGNYSGNGWLGGNIPMFSKLLSLNMNASTGLYSNTNYINGQKNITRNNSYNGNLGISVDLDKYFFDINGSYEYNVPFSTINNQNNLPYTTHTYNFMGRVELPKKFFIESDANYTINSRRTSGYNLNFFIINASVAKHFGKLENLILSAKAFDILNQNISANRQVYNNVITDSKTKIISRYFLLNITYKFNSQKTKEDDNEY